MGKKYQTVNEYMYDFSDVTKDRLTILRQLIKDLLPESEEKISYNIPAYFLNKKPIVYFAGYDKHIGVYPRNTMDDDFNKKAEKYAHGKGTLRFSNDQDLPTELIKEFVILRSKQ